jgi:hypothetical protein
MCFSATASFVTAGITGAIGLATITQPRAFRQAPLAAIPLLFSVQQAVEGMLWLTLADAGGSGLPSLLTYVYLSFALAFWPVFAPLSVWLIEQRPFRRAIMGACMLIGAGVALYFIVSVLNLPHVARIQDGHIVYLVNAATPFAVGGLYLFATGIALMLSSYRAVALMGAVVFGGSVVSYFLYSDAYVSVWCFFAAGSSVLLFLQFYWLGLANGVTAPDVGPAPTS